MKRRIVYICLFMLVIVLFSHISRGAEASQLNDETTKVIPSDILFLEDKEGIFTIDEVTSTELEQFKTVTSITPNFGYTTSVYWLAFTVNNDSLSSNWLLEIDAPPLDDLTIYHVTQDGKYTEVETGDLHPFSQRELPVRSFVFDLQLKEGEEKRFFVRAETEGAMKIPITLWEEHAFFQHNEKQTAIHFAYYGLVLVMTVYNFFLYIFLRNRSYLYYALMSIFFMFIPMTNFGDAYQWLWPNEPWWNNRSIIFFMALSMLFSSIFVMKFLRTEETLPRIHKILKLFIAVQVINVAILLLWSYPIALKMALVTSVIHVPLFFFIGIASWRKKYFLAKYFVFAWSLFLIANLMTVLNDAGYIESQSISKYALLFGSSTELVLFSLGLSAQVNQIRKEKERLNMEIEDAQREIIFTMGEIIEARPKETSNHVKRVAEYSAIVAKSIGISKEKIEKLKVASPMHDIGKVGIPDAILQKPGKLSDEEFNIMKTHTTIGYDMLRHSTRDILKLAAVITYQHHEKFDGTGYPQGLQGQNINIFARITAIADVFDALASDRVYKKAWELDKILALFHEEKGKHFDPILVDAFIQNFNEIVSVRDKLAD